MSALSVLLDGWKLAGIVLGLVGAGAAGMAATVNTKLTHHSTQADTMIVELRKSNALLGEMKCLALAIETKLQCEAKAR